MPEKNGKLADDLLIGAENIADFIGLSPRQVYHQSARLKLKHLGGMLIGSKRRLTELLVGEGGAV